MARTLTPTKPLWEMVLTKQWQCILAGKAFQCCPTVQGWERHWKLVTCLLFTGVLKYPFLGTNPWLRSTFQAGHSIGEQCHWALMEFSANSARFHVRSNPPSSVLTGSSAVGHTDWCGVGLGGGGGGRVGSGEQANGSFSWALRPRLLRPAGRHFLQDALQELSEHVTGLT